MIPEPDDAFSRLGRDGTVMHLSGFALTFLMWARLSVCVQAVRSRVVIDNANRLSGAYDKWVRLGIPFATTCLCWNPKLDNISIAALVAGTATALSAVIRRIAILW